MDKDKFNKAIEINNKIEEYKDHKMALENSNIKYGDEVCNEGRKIHKASVNELIEHFKTKEEQWKQE